MGTEPALPGNVSLPRRALRRGGSKHWDWPRRGMYNILYIIGLVVVILIILSLLGLI